MEKISIEFLEGLGWIKYSRFSDAPENCFYKKPYPIALWWDNLQNVFWVINVNELTANPTIIAKEYLETRDDYDKSLIPILKAREALERRQQ